MKIERLGDYMKVTPKERDEKINEIIDYINAVEQGMKDLRELREKKNE